MGTSGIGGLNYPDVSARVQQLQQQVITQVAGSARPSQSGNSQSTDSAEISTDALQSLEQALISGSAQDVTASTGAGGIPFDGNTYGPPSGFNAAQHFNGQDLVQSLAQAIECDTGQSTTPSTTGATQSASSQGIELTLASSLPLVASGTSSTASQSAGTLGAMEPQLTPAQFQQYNDGSLVLYSSSPGNEMATGPGSVNVVFDTISNKWIPRSSLQGAYFPETPGLTRDPTTGSWYTVSQPIQAAKP